jgi:POT family proton-dependent oligopeptide transporter
MQNKHPVGLPILFLTEMWERFGFYIVQGLLILFMTKVYGFSDDKGFAVLGAFTALVYISPVLGGFVADQILGFQRTIILGNILLAIGYALLVIHSHHTFYLALAVIVVGAGLFKPNISSFLGTLYKRNDPRRESGFTIFYMGINLGVLLATTTSGFIVEKFGWHASFAVASMGLIIGLITFLIGKKYFVRQEYSLPISKIHSRLFNFFKTKTGLALTLIITFIISWILIDHNVIATYLLWIFSLILLIGLIYLAKKYQFEVRNKFFALLILIVSSIVFWAIYFQMFFSLNLFIDRDVNRHVFGFHIPTVMFIGLESLFIFLLGPLFAYVWQRLSAYNINPSTPFKFALATLIIGISFFWLLLGIYLMGQDLVNPIWIVLAYLFVTIGELLLSPIGLSTVTVLSPANLVGMMMGVWFVALGLGGKLAGIIAQQSSVPQTVTDPKIEVTYYKHAFTYYALYGLVVGLIMLLFVPMLRRMIQGERITWRSLFPFT